MDVVAVVLELIESNKDLEIMYLKKNEDGLRLIAQTAK